MELLDHKNFENFKVRLKDGTDLPYKLYLRLQNQMPFKLDELSLVLPSQRMVPLKIFLKIMADENFSCIKLHTPLNMSSLVFDEVVETLENPTEALTLVSNLFKGNYETLAPVIDQYLPQLQNVTVVKTKKNNFIEYPVVKKIQLRQNISLKPVNLDTLDEIEISGEDRISFRNLMKITKALENPENTTIFSGIHSSSIPEQSKEATIKFDDVIPMSQWMAVYGALHPRTHQDYSKICDEVPQVGVHLQSYDVTINSDGEIISIKPWDENVTYQENNEEVLSSPKRTNENGSITLEMDNKTSLLPNSNPLNNEDILTSNAIYFHIPDYVPNKETSSTSGQSMDESVSVDISGITATTSKEVETFSFSKNYSQLIDKEKMTSTVGDASVSENVVTEDPVFLTSTNAIKESNLLDKNELAVTLARVTEVTETGSCSNISKPDSEDSMSRVTSVINSGISEYLASPTKNISTTFDNNTLSITSEKENEAITLTNAPELHVGNRLDTFKSLADEKRMFLISTTNVNEDSLVGENKFSVWSTTEESVTSFRVATPPDYESNLKSVPVVTPGIYENSENDKKMVTSTQSVKNGRLDSNNVAATSAVEENTTIFHPENQNQSFQDTISTDSPKTVLKEKETNGTQTMTSSFKEKSSLIPTEVNLEVSSISPYFPADEVPMPDNKIGNTRFSSDLKKNNADVTSVPLLPKNKTTNENLSASGHNEDAILSTEKSFQNSSISRILNDVSDNQKLKMKKKFSSHTVYVTKINGTESRYFMGEAGGLVSLPIKDVLREIFLPYLHSEGSSGMLESTSNENMVRSKNMPNKNEKWFSMVSPENDANPPTSSATIPDDIQPVERSTNPENQKGILPHSNPYFLRTNEAILGNHFGSPRKDSFTGRNRRFFDLPHYREHRNNIDDSFQNHRPSVKLPKQSVNFRPSQYEAPTTEFDEPNSNFFVSSAELKNSTRPHVQGPAVQNLPYWIPGYEWAPISRMNSNKHSDPNKNVPPRNFFHDFASPHTTFTDQNDDYSSDELGTGSLRFLGDEHADKEDILNRGNVLGISGDKLSHDFTYQDHPDLKKKPRRPTPNVYQKSEPSKRSSKNRLGSRFNDKRQVKGVNFNNNKNEIKKTN